MSEQITELKSTFDSLWRCYVECDVEELAPSGLRLREELVGYVNSLSQGGTPFTQLEAERKDLGAVITEAVDDIKRSQKGYTEGPTIEGVLAMLLVRAAALSEQEE